MPVLVQPLPEGPLDIVGDVHGELDALLALLDRLGCDPERRTVDRPLVFLGDLVDRGPDSPSVVDVVRGLVEAGVAWCVAGNHELNLLQGDKKEGNGWFLGHDDSYQSASTGRRAFESRPIDARDREPTRAFLATLPVVLERPDLRVVHACWDGPSLAALPHEGELAPLSRAAAREVIAELRRTGALARALEQRAEFANLRDHGTRPDRMLDAVQEVSAAEQLKNPYKVLTSGREDPIPFEELYFIGGKWRFVARSRWWEDYTDDAAVVIGHYWRRRKAPVTGKIDLWDRVPPYGWAGPRGNVFCVDYSVGRRFAERWEHPTGQPERFRGGLAALRWPERSLVFDDQPDPISTTGFGGGSISAGAALPP
jgi:hypothetical protein